MPRVLILGARGHGRMLASLHPDAIGFLDRDVSLHGTLIDGKPVLGSQALLEEYGTVPICLGIGTNEDRQPVYDALIEAGYQIVDTRHPSAMVNAGAQIGQNVILNTGCIVEHDCTIADHAHICPGAVLCGGVRVGEGAVIGAGAVVKEGLQIGAWATVGCGAVVVKDVPDGMTVMGVPAHPRGLDAATQAHFQQEGYSVLRGMVPARDVLLMREALAVVLADTAPTLAGRAITHAASGQINSLHVLHTTSFFDRLMQSEKMRLIASTLAGTPVRPRAVEVFAKPAHVGLPSPWHQDQAYWCLDQAVGLTLWVALDACDVENGGLTYLRGSQKLGLLPHVPSHAPGSSQTIPLEALPAYARVTPTLAPGDVLAHHCLTIHGSLANRSDRPRCGVTLQYVGADTREDPVKRAVYEASLETQVKERPCPDGN